MSLLQHLPPLGPLSHPVAEESSREAFVQDLGGRIARFVPGTSAMFFFSWKWRVGPLPGSISMIVKARRVKQMQFSLLFCDGRNCKIQAFAMSGGSVLARLLHVKAQLEEHIC